MVAIEPGLWVECVQNRTPTTLPPRGLVIGAVYQVEAVGVTPPCDSQPGVPWVRLVKPLCRPDKWGFRGAWFRPVYRENPSLTAGLLAAREREAA